MTQGITSVSLRINIKGGGVHQWYIIHDQQSSIGVVFLSGWGSAMVPHFGGNTAITLMGYTSCLTEDVITCPSVLTTLGLYFCL